MRADSKSTFIFLMALEIAAGVLIVFGGLAFYVWAEPMLEAALGWVMVAVLTVGLIVVLGGAVWVFIQLVRSEWTCRSALAQGRIEFGPYQCAGWAIPIRLWPAVAVLCSLSVGSLLMAVLPIGEYAFYVGLRWLVFCTALCLVWFWVRAGLESLYGSADFVFVLLAIVILWNPLFPVQLLKGIWIVLDYVAAMVFVSVGLRLDGRVAAIRQRAAINSGVA